MSKALDQDLKRLKAQAFDRIEWTEATVRRYHALLPKLKAATLLPLRGLYDWLFVPYSLWPFNIRDVLENCLTTLEEGKRLNSRQLLVIEMLPEPPDDAVCATVTDHERNVQAGKYENMLKMEAKYSQNELSIRADPELRRQWSRIKAEFNVKAYCDYKGVIRRTMNVERNLRPLFSVNMHRQREVFQASFDAFCLRWNLYGMQHDEPLPLKLAVNLTPYGTMIHIPSYWSFDPKRDIHWDAIANLHRVRVHGRQGISLAEGLAERMKAARKLQRLDKQALRLGLKGEKKHEFLCAGLGWVPGTSPKRIRRLRHEFKK